jgi:hypothetical protein
MQSTKITSSSVSQSKKPNLGKLLSDFFVKVESKIPQIYKLDEMQNLKAGFEAGFDETIIEQLVLACIDKISHDYPKHGVIRGLQEWQKMFVSFTKNLSVVSIDHGPPNEERLISFFECMQHSDPKLYEKINMDELCKSFLLDPRSKQTISLVTNKQSSLYEAMSDWYVPFCQWANEFKEFNENK